MSESRPMAPRYRLVALDLDGTLLDDAGNLSPHTCATVCEVVASGVTVVLATSRRFTGAAPVADALHLHGPLILYDGAQTCEYPGGALLDSRALGRRTARLAIEAIAGWALRPVVQYAAQSGERLLVSPPVGRAAYDREYVGRFSDQITELPLAKLVEGPAPLLRIVAFGPLDRLSRAAESVASLPCGWQLLPQGNYGAAELSVFSRRASKGAALRRLAARLGIDTRATLAIGDGINDISMLSVAGLGIAMGNAEPAVRAVAGALTVSNAEDGVALALEQYMLNQR